jgi:hypothetical protein
VLSASGQVVGECHLTVHKLAEFSSVKMFNECVLPEVLIAMKLLNNCFLGYDISYLPKIGRKLVPLTSELFMLPRAKR